MRHINFFQGAQNGEFWGPKKVYVENVYLCFFRHSFWKQKWLTERNRRSGAPATYPDLEEPKTLNSMFCWHSLASLKGAFWLLKVLFWLLMCFGRKHPWLCQDFSKLFAMGPVQFSWPRGVAENVFTKPGFWEHFVDFPRKQQTQSSLNFFSRHPGNLLNLIFRDWPRSGEFRFLGGFVLSRIQELLTQTPR